MFTYVYDFFLFSISWETPILCLCSSQVPPVKELRKLLRIQALRCNVIYCQNGSRINVIPVLASRSQALRWSFYVPFNAIMILLLNVALIAMVVHFIHHKTLAIQSSLLKVD